MPAKKSKRRKPRKDIRKVTLPLPEELYFVIKQMADSDYRYMAQEIRYLIEVGLTTLAASGQLCVEEEGEEEQELEPAIGFKIEHFDASEKNED